MRIAVTGASGWVGRAVTDVAVTRGHDVIAIDLDDTPPPSATAFIRADMQDYEAVLVASDDVRRWRVAGLTGLAREATP